MANQGLLDVLAGGGFVVKEFTLADIFGRHRNTRCTLGHGGAAGAERLTNDGELDPLRRLRDDWDAILVRTIDSFARYLDLNEAFHSNAGRPRQESHVAVDDGTGSGSPVCCPERVVFASSKLPRAAEGIAVTHEPHWAIVEAIEKRQRTRAESPAREHSLMSRRNLEAALDD